MGIEIITSYFPNLTTEQIEQFARLDKSYREWNDKINVISRKDIDNLYIHHILHSLGIAMFIKFKPKSKVLDFGTGGGFPGIPLAILMPEVDFHLVDSIGKKIHVAENIANEIGLKNTTFNHGRAEKEAEKHYDFIVSRAVMSLGDLVKLGRGLIKTKGINAIPNGIICLKGGDLEEELKPFKNRVVKEELSLYFKETFFETKKVIYLPI